MNRLTLTERLILSFLFIGITSVAIVSVFSYTTTRKALVERAYDQLTSVLYHKQDELIHYFDDRINDSRDISLKVADIMAKKDFGTEMIPSLYAIFQESPRISKYFSEIIVTQGKNQIRVKAAGGGLMGQTETDGFVEAGRIQDDAFSYPFIKDYMLQNKVLVPPEISTIFNATPQAIRVDMRLRQDHLGAIMVENNPLEGMGESGESYLVGKDRLMRSPSRFIPESILQVAVNTPAVQNAFNGINGHQITLDYRGVEVLSCYNKLNLDGLEWAILAEMDIQETIRPALHAKYRIVVISILLAFLIFLFALIISRRLTLPIRNLTKAAEEITRGKPIDPVQQAGNDELGALVTTFNTMAAQIEHHKRKSNAEKFGRLRSMIDGQEMERRRISRELHDGLGQNLIAIKMKLNTIADLPEKEKRHTLEELSRWFEKTIEEIRRMSNDLIPEELDSFGLIRATGNLLVTVSDATGIEIEYSHTGIKTIHDKKTKTYLFRIIQEGVNNVVKHASATKLTVSLNREAQQLILRIGDNGCGLDEHSKSLSGNGILNMKERASLLQGSFSIESDPKNGTLITVTVPCQNINYESD